MTLSAAVQGTSTCQEQRCDTQCFVAMGQCVRALRVVHLLLSFLVSVHQSVQHDIISIQHGSSTKAHSDIKMQVNIFKTG